MVSAATAPLMQAATKAIARISKEADHTEDISRAARTLQRLFDQTSPIDGAARDGGSLIGSGNEIIFNTYDLTAGGFVERRVEITTRASQALVLQVGMPSAKAAEVTLLEGFDKGAFSYLETSNGSRPSAWVGAWRNPEIPRLVRFKAVHSENEAILLEFSIQTNGRLHCAFDPISRRCRG